MNWYLKVLQNYAVFSGRARRMEYWYFTLFNIIFMLILMGVDTVAGLFNEVYSIGMLSGIYSVAIVVPSIAVLVRRLHDTSRSAWWLLIALIPLIGSITLFVFSVFDSEPGSNEYGPNPK